MASNLHFSASDRPVSCCLHGFFAGRRRSEMFTQFGAPLCSCTEACAPEIGDKESWPTATIIKHNPTFARFLRHFFASKYTNSNQPELAPDVEFSRFIRTSLHLLDYLTLTSCAITEKVLKRTGFTRTGVALHQLSRRKLAFQEQRPKTNLTCTGSGTW